MITGRKIKIIRKSDPLARATQASQSSHAVKGKYVDRRLDFTNSTEARFILGVPSQSGNHGGQDKLRELPEISPLQAGCRKILCDLKSKGQQKLEQRRQEPERRMKNDRWMPARGAVRRLRSKRPATGVNDKTDSN
jgi:hypothetical protein